jgi:hypothetical protein
MIVTTTSTHRITVDGNLVQYDAKAPQLRGFLFPLANSLNDSTFNSPSEKHLRFYQKPPPIFFILKPINMRKVLLCFLLAGAAACNNQTAEKPMVKDVTANNKQQPAEFADPKYMDIGKQMLTAMEQGNIDAWSNMYADNAVYNWSAGDSLAGKKAILDYWKNRRANVIDSIHFSNDIWTPLKVNQPQRGPDMPGVWLLSWYQVDVKYKNGKKLMFWTHTDHHFDANGKIDRTIQYIDRAPINKALGMK